MKYVSDLRECKKYEENHIISIYSNVIQSFEGLNAVNRKVKVK